MSDLSRIYSAVYSGVPVFEMVVNNVAVMRRRTDSYMNATQILKVAKIDKGKRTKILEKEVLIGEHEKVQGGYGKYQGTWIPFDKSRELAEKYGVFEELGPLFNFDLNNLCTKDGEDSLLTKEQALAARRKLNAETMKQQQETTTQQKTEQHQAQKHHQDQQQHQQQILLQQQQQHIHQQQQQQQQINQQQQQHQLQQQHQQQQEHHHYQQQSPVRQQTPQMHHSPQSSQQRYNTLPSTLDEPLKPRKKPKIVIEETSEQSAANERDRSILMSIFLSDKPDQIPDLLKNTQGKPTFNVDMVIDEQGHTALHWATALAREKTIELLVSKGANISCTSYTGETPLMRGVMVTNSFDNRTFSKTFELLKDSIGIRDNKKRTVLHHAALTAGIHGRTNAAVYYMKTILDAVLNGDESMKSIINAQDSLGDTALNIAARLDCQPLVDILVKAGATQSAENNNGLQMRDYNDTDTFMEEASKVSREIPNPSVFKKILPASQRGKEIVATVQKIVDALDDEYGGQLAMKEQELQRVQEELNTVTKELESTRKGLEERQAQSQKLSEAQQKTRNIENALETGWHQLEEIMKKAGKPMPSLSDIENIDEDEDIDALFNVPELVIPEDATEEQKKKKMNEYIKDLQAKVEAYTINDQTLEKEIKTLEDQFNEKEMQCKRLIAACCNLPIDKIDELVEPLTLAIESDPPDLDLARVIGFMEKIRRQGAFAEPSNAPPTSVPVSAMPDTPTTPMVPHTDMDSTMAETPEQDHFTPMATDSPGPAIPGESSDSNTYSVPATESSK